LRQPGVEGKSARGGAALQFLCLVKRRLTGRAREAARRCGACCGRRPARSARGS
jgi:hypothetical protein